MGGMLNRPQKRKASLGVRGVPIYCANYQRLHWTAISGDRWPDDVRLSDLEPRFTCQACGRHGADVRPDFDWDKKIARSAARLRVLPANRQIE
jgi:hypothetical protein